MILEAFLVCALALPSKVIPRPKYIKLLAANDPKIHHNGNGKILVIRKYNEMVVINLPWSWTIQADPWAIPFIAGAFVMIYKQTPGLNYAVLKEMHRVLQLGGFIALREEKHDLMKSFNYRIFPYPIGPYVLYQKLRVKPQIRKK